MKQRYRRKSWTRKFTFKLRIRVTGTSRVGEGMDNYCEELMVRFAKVRERLNQESLGPLTIWPRVTEIVKSTLGVQQLPDDGMIFDTEVFYPPRAEGWDDVKTKPELFPHQQKVLDRIQTTPLSGVGLEAYEGTGLGITALRSMKQG